MTEQGTPAGPSSRILWALRASVVATGVAVAVASFLPGERLWGLNHLAFYPTVVRVVALLLVGAAFLPPVARGVYSGLLRVSHAIGHGGRLVEAALALVAVLSIFAFVGLSASTRLLGDGQLVADSFEKAMTDAQRADAMIHKDQVSRGTNLLYYHAARNATTRFGEPAAAGIRYLNCILGMVFLYIFFGIIRQAKMSSEERLWLVVLTLSSGAMVLFFGYVETYTPMLFLLFLYVASSLRALRGQGRMWLSPVLLGLAIYAHIQAVLFVPSLIFLLVHRLAAGRGLATGLAAALIAAAVVIGVILGGLFTSLGTYMIPVLSHGDTPGLLSFAHWADMANEVVLLVPAILFVVVAIWAGARLQRGADGERAPAEGSPDEWRFTRLIVLPCGLYLLLFDPAIGMVRDWDLFAMVAVGLVPLSLLGIQRLIRHIPQRSDAAAFAAPAIVLSVVMAAAWIGVNASPDRSAGRFESMFEYDRVHAPYAYENLATYYYSRGDTTGAIRQMKAATALSHNPRQYLALALYYDESGNSTEAMEALKTALASRPDYADARLLATTILAREGRLEELAAYAREGTVHNPGQAILWFHLGQAQILLGNVDDGVAALQSCLGANPTPELAQRARGLIQLYTAEE